MPSRLPDRSLLSHATFTSRSRPDLGLKASLVSYTFTKFQITNRNTAITSTRLAISHLMTSSHMVQLDEATVSSGLRFDSLEYGVLSSKALPLGSEVSRSIVPLSLVYS